MIYFVVLLAYILIFWSFYWCQKSNYRFAISFLLIGGLLLRIFVALDGELHTWDEQYHALVAKNLMSNPLVPKLYSIPILDYNYKVWVGNYIWLHKPPFALWVIALFLKILGTSEFIVRLPSVLSSTLSIYLLYGIGTYIKDKRTGFLSAWFLAMNGFIIELAGGRIATDHIDSIFSFIFLCIIFLAIKLNAIKSIYYSIVIGLVLGMALLTKWAIAFFAVPVVFFILLDLGYSRRIILLRLSMILAMSIFIALPWHYYTFTAFPREAFWESDYNFRHLFEYLEHHQHGFGYFIEVIRICFHDAIYLPLIWFFFIVFKNSAYKPWILSSWFFIPLVFFSMAKTKMHGYIVFTGGAYFLIASLFVIHIYERTSIYPYMKYMIVLIMIALPFRYSIERVKPLDINTRPSWVAELKNIEQMNRRNKTTVLFNFDEPIRAMFYTDMVVYDRYPTQQLVDSLADKGYDIIVNQNEQIVGVRSINISTRLND